MRLFLLPALLTLSFGVARADKPDQNWDIVQLDEQDETARASRSFLNVPIYYGDWVPIDKAEATIKAVASSIQQAYSPPTQEKHFVSERVEKPFVSERVDHTFHKEPFREEFGPSPKRPQGARNQRLRWNSRPLRRQDHHHKNTRRHRKLPPPTSFVDQITSFFTGGSSNPPPPPPKQLRKPLSPVGPSLPPPTASVPSPSEPTFSLSNVFNIPSLLRSKPKKPFVQEQQQNVPEGPVIKLIPAPDLTENGPPVLEVGGNYHDQLEGEIIFGRRPTNDHLSGFENIDHLSGFVPVDFEHATSDEKPVKKNKAFSVVVSGVNQQTVSDPNELAKLFKEGQVAEKHKAYIAPDDEVVPSGFQKINLPFMEHAGESGELPSVFIAPVGFRVPEGYKGHPLPYDPTIEGVTVVHTTDKGHEEKQIVTEKTTEEKETDSQNKYSASDLIRNKLKIAKARPSLANFYKNKARKEETRVPFEGPLNKDEASKKRRILTKIVRRPFKIRNSFGSTKTVLETVSVEKIEKPAENPFLTEKAPTFVEVTTTTTTEEPTSTEEIQSEAVETYEESTTVTSPESLFDEVEVSTEEKTTEKFDYFEPTTQTERVEEEEDETVQQTTFLPPTPLPVKETTQSTTEEPSTTTKSHFYEPTPFSYVRPIRRLDSFKFKPNLTRLRTTVSTTVTTTTTTTAETVSTTEESRFPNHGRFKFRKYDSQNKGNRHDSGIFGQRIRSRKRPALWANGYGGYESYETDSTTTTEATKTDVYKKKFRPFFDQLYDKLTHGDEEPESVKKFWARRSTTTPNPYTIDAEIYEVHPQSGKIVPVTSAPDVTQVPELYEYAHDYGHEEYTYEDYEDKVEKSTEETKDVSSTPPPLEYNEYSISEEVEATTEHETADKHAEVHPVIEETLAHSDDYLTGEEEIYPEDQVPVEEESYYPENNPALPLNIDTPYKYPEAPLNYDYVENDIIDTKDKLDYAESQRVHNTWSDIQVLPADESKPERLSEYDKTFKPSHQIKTDHVNNFGSNENVVNEHSQQRITVQEGEFVPFQEQTGLKRPKYVEIQRQSAEERYDVLPITVEQVPTVVDEEILFDVLKDIQVEEEYESSSQQTPVEETTSKVEESTTTGEEEVETVSATEKVFDETTTPDDLQEYDEEEIAYTENIELTETATDVTTEESVEVSEPTEDVVHTTEENVEDYEDSTSVFITPTENQVVEVEETTKLESVSTTEGVSSTEVDLDEETTVEPEEIFETTAEPTTTTANSLFGEFSLGGFLNYLLPTRKTENITITTTVPEISTEDSDVSTEIPEISTEDSEIGTEVSEISTEESEVVETTAVHTTEVSSSEEIREEARPKSIDTSNIFVPNSPTDTYEHDLSPPKKFLHDKLDSVVKKREELIKNWVARKYKGGKHSVLNPTTANPNEAEQTTSHQAQDLSLLPFAPTIPPKNKYFHVDLEATVRDGTNEITKNLVSKYKNARNPLIAPSQNRVESIPIGSSRDVYKSWGGDSLSQADFEKTVLGVSTATEVSVKSIICVRGRCFNADDMDSLIDN